MRRVVVTSIACALLAVTARAQFAPQTWPADQDGANFICADVGYFQANNLAGVGTRFACTDSTGKLVASATACVASGAVVSSVTGGGGLVCSPTTGAVACTMGSFTCSAGDFVSSSSTGGLACTPPAYSHWSDGTFSPLPQEPLSAAGAGLSIADDPTDGATVISLPPTGSAGSCTNCSVTFDLFGRATTHSSGSGGGVSSVTGTAQRVSATPTTGAVVVDTIGGYSTGAVTGGNVDMGSLASGVNEQVTTAGTAAPLTYQCVAGEVQFGAASGGGLAQDPRLYWDPANHRLGVGTNTPGEDFDIVHDGGAALFAVTSYNTAGSDRSILFFRTAEGSQASPASIAVGDEMGEFIGAGYAGGAFRNVADMDFRAAPGTISGTSLPSLVAFETTPNGSVTRRDTFYLYSDFTAGMFAAAAPGTPSAGQATLYVDSTSKNIAVKNDAGTVNHGVQSQSSTAGVAVTGIADNGSVTTQSFTVPGTAVTCGQLPAFTGAVGKLLASCVTTINAVPCGALPGFTGAVSNSGGGTCATTVNFSGLTGSASCSQLPAFTGAFTNSGCAISYAGLPGGNEALFSTSATAVPIGDSQITLDGGNHTFVFGAQTSTSGQLASFSATGQLLPAAESKMIVPFDVVFTPASLNGTTLCAATSSQTMSVFIDEYPAGTIMKFWRLRANLLSNTMISGAFNAELTRNGSVLGSAAVLPSTTGVVGAQGTTGSSAGTDTYGVCFTSSTATGGVNMHVTATMELGPFPL